MKKTADDRFTVSVQQLERGKVDYDFELDLDFLNWLCLDTEARPAGKAGHASVQFFLQGREIVVTGQVEAELIVPCARTLDDAEYHLQAKLFALLAPAGTARRSAGSRKPSDDEDLELTADDAAREEYVGDEIVLDRLFRDHLLLEIPMFPLRSDLRNQSTPAISPLPSSAVSVEQEKSDLDPRLAPFAQLAEQLKKSKKE